MSYGFLFWLLVILSILFGGWWWRSGNAWGPVGGGFLTLVLIVLLGLKVFGWPIHG